jgi:hypothetical protein
LEHGLDTPEATAAHDDLIGCGTGLFRFSSIHVLSRVEVENRRQQRDG